MPLGKYLTVVAYLCKVIPNKDHPTDAGSCVWNVWNGKGWVFKVKKFGKYRPLTKGERDYMKTLEP